VGPRDVLDAVVKRKIPSPRRESNLRTPIVQPVAQIIGSIGESISMFKSYSKKTKNLFDQVHLSRKEGTEY
jgi:hypothetical protein